MMSEFSDDKDALLEYISQCLYKVNRENGLRRCKDRLTALIRYQADEEEWKKWRI